MYILQHSHCAEKLPNFYSYQESRLVGRNCHLAIGIPNWNKLVVLINKEQKTYF